jgi:uncharacterized protein (DUF302 family)
MYLIKSVSLILSLALITSCGGKSDIEIAAELVKIEIVTKKVDNAVETLEGQISSFKTITALDHHRMAEEEGVYTPPSIVTIFSNTKVNSNLLKINQLIGIDLPYKVLCFSEPDLADASIAYTSPEFIIKRHGLKDHDLVDFSIDINTVVNSFPKNTISSTDVSHVEKNFGIIIKQSEFDFNTTLKNLMIAVKGQGDTEIFGEIDFQLEAKQNNIELSPTTLILFGAPEPGGKAMNKCPKIGLDAFCQKLLVYEKEDEVFVAYNDIVAFSELYYSDWTIPQRVINYRLNSVFEDAISEK